MKYRQAVALLVAWSLLGLSAGASAAVLVTLPDFKTLADIPWLAVFIGITIAFGSALLRTTARWVKMVKKGVAPEEDVALWRHLVADGVAGILGGAVVTAGYLGSGYYDPFYHLGMMVLVGWAGDAKVDRLLKLIWDRLTLAFSGKSADPKRPRR